MFTIIDIITILGAFIAIINLIGNYLVVFGSKMNYNIDCALFLEGKYRISLNSPLFNALKFIGFH